MKPARRSLTDFDETERAVIETVRGWFPGDIAVFGSRARGNWATDSDIDLGVHGYVYSLHKKVVQVLRSSLDIDVDLFKFEHALTHRSVVVV